MNKLKCPTGEKSCKPDGWPAGNPKFMNTKKAWDLVGGLSKPGKMPGWSIGIPAAECNTGSKLRLIPNSVCSTCYALKAAMFLKLCRMLSIEGSRLLKKSYGSSQW